MRWPSRAGSFFLPACLGALLASLLAMAKLLSSLRKAPSLSQIAELPIWILVVAITLFPVSLASAACTRVVCRSSVKPSTFFLILLAAGLSVSSAYVFHWYMKTLIPGVNWWRGWWYPVSAALAAVVFQMRARSRASVVVSH